MINIDFSEIVSLSKIWFYILDKDNTILYQDYAVSDNEKFIESITSLLRLLQNSDKILGFEKINPQEFHCKIKNSDKTIVICLSLILLKKSEIEKIIKNHSIGNLIDRLQGNS